MKKRKHVFIDLRSDFGFKHCMSDPIIMKSFLNAVLEDDYGRIESVEFENVEVQKERHEHRGVVFDLRCRLADDRKILVEMQNYTHPYFKTRANYYLYKLMDEHIKRGMNWAKMENDMPSLIGVFIMGKEMADLDKPITRSAEFDMDKKSLFWNGMRKFFISLPHVEKLTQSSSCREIWLNMFKNLGNMEIIDESILERADEGLLHLIEKARTAALSQNEYAEYESSLKRLADEGAAEVYGFKKGLEEGKAIGLQEGKAMGMQEGKAMGLQEGKAMGLQEGKAMGEINAQREIAKLLVADGVDNKKIIQYCPLLSLEEIEEIRNL